jgi:hypothetical protein
LKRKIRRDRHGITLQPTNMVFKAQNWHFTIKNSTLEHQTRIKHLVSSNSSVRYVAYFLDASMMQGFVYNRTCVSKNQVLNMSNNAIWQPITGKLRDNDSYCTKQSTGLLIEIGCIPGGEKSRKRNIAAMEEIEECISDRVQHYEEKIRVLERQVEDVKIELAIEKEKAQVLERQVEDVNIKLANEKERAQRFQEGVKEELDNAARQSIGVMRDLFEQTKYQMDIANISISLWRIYTWHSSFNQEAKLAIDPACRDIEDIGKALKQAKMHYHPDKAVVGGFWCSIVAGEIMKFINHLQEEYTNKY